MRAVGDKVIVTLGKTKLPGTIAYVAMDESRSADHRGYMVDVEADRSDPFGRNHIERVTRVFLKEEQLSDGGGDGD